MSQMSHRPATKVTLSPASRVQKNMKRVVELETQLETQLISHQPGKKAEEQASRLRMMLCETIADVVLTDPVFAAKNDCIGRLWRTCFYAPIGQLRSRISREKRKKGPNVATLEQNLKHFLEEAITLYDYLVKKYQEKLLPDDMFSPNSQLSTQSSRNSSQEESLYHSMKGNNNKEAVVPGLFRMYIHKGDLHRYAAAYGTAQNCYSKASELAPGMGNPYNQLAVSAQLKDAAAPLNCVALYWYARSLLTTHERFEISRSNLARMFQSNREWFRQLPPLEELKDGREMARAQRTVASRQFLAGFVDLHYSFFQGVSPLGRENTILCEGDIVKMIKDQRQPFETLLRASAFGDALLLKMVCINAFAETYVPLASFESSSDDEAVALTASLARMHTLAFGNCVAERVILNLGKNPADRPEKGGSSTGKSAPSVRMVLPLLILCQFVASNPCGFSAPVGQATKDFYDEVFTQFWEKIVCILNILQSFGDVDEIGSEIATKAVLKEYTGLRGFTPFKNFVEFDGSTLENGFLMAEEAMKLLEVTQSCSQGSACQSSTQDSLSNLSPAEETRVKIARFLAFGDQLTVENETEVGNRFARREDGFFVWNDDKNKDDDDNDDDIVMDEPEEQQDLEETTAPADETDMKAGVESEGDSILLYKVPEGGGPALLVPGLFLQSKAMESNTMTADSAPVGLEKNGDSPEGIAVEEMAVEGLEPEATQENTAVPARIMPPPGFGRPVPSGNGPVATSPNVAAPDSGFLGRHNVENATVESALNFQQYAAAPVHHPPGNPLGLFTNVASQPQLYSGDSLDLFGGQAIIQTANPFAAAPGMVNQNPSGNNLYGYNREQTFLDTSVERHESSLLGAGLLNSLWMEESGEKTQNPFAT